MELIGARPGRKVIIYFAATIVVGTIFLYLPISSAGDSIGLIDAFFTSTSAVCVTGLTVLDTGSDFSFFGQIVILVLIQLGGLGIMTFATSLLMMMGARVSFYDRIGIFENFGNWTRTGTILAAIILTTIAIEGLGAVALYAQFSQEFPSDVAVFYSIFHSVSAFCNAGFSTFPNSLESYNGNLYILGVFSLLIIIGGLGFIVIGEIFSRLFRFRSMLSLHAKLCLSVTAILLGAGTIIFFAIEYNNSFGDMSFIDSLSNAFFQAVTCRTAGFNAIPQVNLTEVGLLVTLILMFIGACPGSTGGGIKTTTGAVILLLVYNRFRGRKSIPVFKRSIDNDSIRRALTATLLASLIIVVMFALLMLAEQRPQPHQLSQGWFVDNLFEVVSAFGTVGLSLGITGHATVTGKLIIIVLMFIGRVGLLTLAFSLARPAEPGEIVYAGESVMIG
ncbi:MAG: TrkH family potassium uptake protein [candidate division Zixibacteria bacterium]